MVAQLATLWEPLAAHCARVAPLSGVARLVYLLLDAGLEGLGTVATGELLGGQMGSTVGLVESPIAEDNVAKLALCSCANTEVKSTHR
jgi:hypothetical protein